MALTETQLARCKYLLEGVWLTPDRDELVAKFQQSLSEVESSEELHQFVLNYNWDDGVDRLAEVLDHPLCDYGTALFVFWVGEPWTVYAMTERPPEPDWKQEHYDLIKTIERKCLSKAFQVASIKVDPTNIVGLNYLEINADWQRDGYKRIPLGMTWPSPGEEIVRLPLT